METERNLPDIHISLHVVAFTFADELLAELLNFRNFVAFHDNRKLTFPGTGQKAPFFFALALEERCEVRDDSIGHFIAKPVDNRLIVIDFYK